MAKPNLIYNTWTDGGFLKGCCTCGHTFEVTISEFSNEAEARKGLEKKFHEHVKEKHPREDFSQAAARVVREATKD
jgi:hypothetical protein